jgi:hypothetical protein
MEADCRSEILSKLELHTVINTHRTGLHMEHLCDEGICRQPTRLFAAQKVVQITECVLHHILVNDNLTWTVIFPFW